MKKLGLWRVFFFLSRSLVDRKLPSPPPLLLLFRSSFGSQLSCSCMLLGSEKLLLVQREIRRYRANLQQISNKPCGLSFCSMTLTFWCITDVSSESALAKLYYNLAISWLYRTHFVTLIHFSSRPTFLVKIYRFSAKCSKNHVIFTIFQHKSSVRV